MIAFPYDAIVAWMIANAANKAPDVQRVKTG